VDSIGWAAERSGKKKRWKKGSPELLKYKKMARTDWGTSRFNDSDGTSHGGKGVAGKPLNEGTI